MARDQHPPPASGIASGTVSRMPTSTPEKVRENLLRRMADRQGLRLEKSRRRDPYAWGYGTYQLVDNATGALVTANANGRGYGWTLDEIEERLTERTA